MSDHKLRWGIIGPGNIARQFATCLPHADTAVLTAVGSRSKDKAQAFATEFGAAQAYGSYEELAADPDAVNTASQPEQVLPRNSVWTHSLKDGQGRAQYTFPAHSFTVMVLE